jgi:GNAT superfamily N-acetyltransferase
MKAQIRKIEKNEIDIFFDVFSKCIKTQFPEYSINKIRYFLSKMWSKKEYRKCFADKARFILGAWIDRRLVGILDAKMPVGGVSRCVWLMVELDFQGQGVGKKLLDEWERIVKIKGAHSLYLDADNRNVPFYKKVGFSKIGFWKKSWFGNDMYLFAKTIQEPREENYLK